MDVVFEVIEGNVSEVERISFVGNKAFSESRLRRVFATKQAGVLHRIISRDTFIEDRIELDKQLLRDFYLARGYVDFEILSVASRFSRERNAFFLTVTVKGGQKFGSGRSPPAAICRKSTRRLSLRCRRSVPAPPIRLFGSKTRLPDGKPCGAAGAQLHPRRSANHAERPGPDAGRQFRFGQRTADLRRADRYRRQCHDLGPGGPPWRPKTVEGDPFNPREIRKSAETIRALGLFTTADVEARQGTADDQVIVDVNVDEALTGWSASGRRTARTTASV